MSEHPSVQVVFLDQFRPVAKKYLPQSPFFALIVGNTTQATDQDLSGMIESLTKQQCNAIIFSGPEATRIKDNRIRKFQNLCPVSYMAGNNFSDILNTFSGNIFPAMGPAAIIVIGQGKNLMRVLSDIKAAGIKMR